MGSSRRSAAVPRGAACECAVPVLSGQRPDRPSQPAAEGRSGYAGLRRGVREPQQSEAAVPCWHSHHIDPARSGDLSSNICCIPYLAAVVDNQHLQGGTGPMCCDRSVCGRAVSSAWRPRPKSSCKQTLEVSMLPISQQKKNRAINVWLPYRHGQEGRPDPVAALRLLFRGPHRSAQQCADVAHRSAGCPGQAIAPIPCPSMSY